MTQSEGNGCAECKVRQGASGLARFSHSLIEVTRIDMDCGGSTPLLRNEARLVGRIAFVGLAIGRRVKPRRQKRRRDRRTPYRLLPLLTQLATLPERAQAR